MIVVKNKVDPQWLNISFRFFLVLDSSLLGSVSITGFSSFSGSGFVGLEVRSKLNGYNIIEYYILLALIRFSFVSNFFLLSAIDIMLIQEIKDVKLRYNCYLLLIYLC